MPLWFARGLRRGVVTTRYPARPDGSAAVLPTPPAFRPRKLTRELADLMIAVCPGGAAPARRCADLRRRRLHRLRPVRPGGAGRGYAERGIRARGHRPGRAGEDDPDPRGQR